MRLFMRVNSQKVTFDMERTAPQTLNIGNHIYQPSRLARTIRKMANRMWGQAIGSGLLDERLYFEVIENSRPWSYGGDGGNFTPADGPSVFLGKWTEHDTACIALHECAHEVHYHDGGYDLSDWIVREALALMAEREGGLDRTEIFVEEPYHTAANLIDQLYQLRAFKRLPFQKRWNDMRQVIESVDLADTVNYYLDRSEGLGLSRWLQRYSQQVEVREELLRVLAYCSLQYSIAYRRTLIRSLVRCKPSTPHERIINVLNAIITLDWRNPEEDMSRIIEFCFAPLHGTRRKLLAFG